MVLPNSVSRLLWLSGTLLPIACGSLELGAPSSTRHTNVVTATSSSPRGLLDGPPDALASDYIPERDFVIPEAQDMGLNPMLGINTSRRHLFVALRPDATVARANQAFAVASNGQLAGTIPPIGVVQLEFPENTTFDELEASAAALESNPTIDGVTEDIPLLPDVVPEPSTLQWQPSAFSWTWGEPAGANWGLEEIRAPNAWNLNYAIQRALENGTSQLPQVAIIDTFKSHSDLNGILSADSYADALDEHAEHGTAIAGIIGAGWGNGQGIDGVAPFVRIRGVGFLEGVGYPEVAHAWEAEEHVSYGTATLLTAIWNLRTLSPRPRVVSISLGYSWYLQCYSNSRCDPRPNNTPGRILDSGCDNNLVRRRIEVAGRLMGNLVHELQSGGAMLFVLSAGNSSGPIASQPWCRHRSQSPGMGDFPADLDGPAKWAAVNDARVHDSIIVAEALELGPTGAQRASYSNVDGQGVFAPGSRIGTLRATPLAPPVTLQWGTSFATPFVAGAAAFLLSIKPTLDNTSLRQLLTATPYARPLTSSQRLLSDTPNELDLFGAALGLDPLPAATPPTVQTWLADFDDGTADGARRIIYTDDNLVDRTDISDTHGDGKVDLRDFRRFRDAFLQATATVGDEFGIDGSPDHPKRDLNWDSVETAEVEFYPRAGLNEDMRLTSEDLQRLVDVYQTDETQPWRAEDLPGLLYSADLIVRAEDIRTALGAIEIRISIEGDTTAPTRVPLPSTLAPLHNIMLLAGAEETIFTTPLLTKAKIKWRPVYADGPGEYEFIQEVGDLRPGEDQVVALSCPTIAVETIVEGFASRTCSGSRWLGCCMTCDWCAGTALLGVTGNETIEACRTDAENCPYDFDWSCGTLPCNFGINEDNATASLSFSQWMTPSCFSSVSSDVYVAVEIRGCSPSRVDTRVDYECVTSGLTCY